MLRKSLALAVGLAALSLVATADEKKADKKMSIKEIMKKGHAGTKSIMAGLKAQVKDGKWDDAADGAKTLKAFGESLGDIKPPKGSDESWKKQSDLYKENTAAVATAVEAKDAKAANAALGKLGGSCMGCHSAHKGK